MLTFEYKARDLKSNKIVHSTVRATSEREAGKLLMDRDLVPLNIAAEGSGKGPLDSIKNRVSTKDRIIFIRQLATLINAGLPLSKSLVTAQDQTQSKALKAVVQDVVARVEGGATLADAFSHHKEFDELFIALVAAGEVSGTLDKSLERIADQQEKDAEIAGKVKGCLVYPIIVLVVIVGVVVFMLTTVVPQIDNLYKSLNQTLPILTSALVAVASFIQNFWYAIILALVVGGFYIKRYLATDGGRRKLDAIKLNIPLFGVMFRKLYMARFTRTGQTLLNSGVPMLDMLKIAANSSGNVHVKKSILNASEKVKTGKGLAESLQREDYILPLVPQMISIGEESGTTDQMMGKAATFYENELDNAIKSIATAIEPLLMVVLAVVAGGMVGAILLPIYQLVGNNSI